MWKEGGREGRREDVSYPWSSTGALASANNKCLGSVCLVSPSDSGYKTPYPSAFRWYPQAKLGDSSTSVNTLSTAVSVHLSPNARSCTDDHIFPTMPSSESIILQKCPMRMPWKDARGRRREEEKKGKERGKRDWRRGGEGKREVKINVQGSFHNNKWLAMRWERFPRGRGEKNRNIWKWVHFLFYKSQGITDEYFKQEGSIS